MRRKIQSIVTLLGSLLTVMIVCAQFFNFQVKDSDPDQELKTEQHQNNGTEEAFIALPSLSLPTPIHVQSGLDTYCLFEILFEDKQTSISTVETPPFPRKLFNTLFRVIISPNAP